MSGWDFFLVRELDGKIEYPDTSYVSIGGDFKNLTELTGFLGGLGFELVSVVPILGKQNDSHGRPIPYTAGRELWFKRPKSA